MVLIRATQMERLRQEGITAFETEMVSHVRRFAPRHCESLEESDIRTAIRYGMDRARTYGFTARGPVRFYLELMFMLGCDFDTDPLLPWVAPVLTDTSTAYQMPRAERLFDRLQDYLHAVAEPEHGYVRAALEAIAADRDASAPPLDHDFAPRMVASLERFYPQKCRFAGEPALRALIRHAAEEAAAHDVGTPDGVVLLTSLMFAAGHGCVHDPLLPWIAGTLGNTKVADPAVRVQRLRSKSLTYLDHVIRHLRNT